jgi:hypothetical protein
MSAWLIYDRDAQNLLSPGTAPIRFDSRKDAEKHLDRLPREKVVRGTYQIIREP